MCYIAKFHFYGGFHGVRLGAEFGWRKSTRNLRLEKEEDGWVWKGRFWGALRKFLLIWTIQRWHYWESLMDTRSEDFIYAEFIHFLSRSALIRRFRTPSRHLLLSSGWFVFMGIPFTQKIILTNNNLARKSHRLSLIFYSLFPWSFSLFILRFQLLLLIIFLNKFVQRVRQDWG